MYIALLLLFIGTSSAEFLSNGCPQDFSVHLLLKHETDCTKFYSCSNGRAILMSCGPGTAFDEKAQGCVFQERLECSENDPNFIFSGGTLANGCPSDGSINKLLPHETDCDKFYQCVHGNKVQMLCAPGTHFNVKTENCDWPSAANCVPSSATTTVTTQPTTTTTTQRSTTQSDIVFLPNGCPTDFSVHFLLPHESDCTKFYYCNFGEKVERECAPGTHFNPVQQVCDWPWAANCTSSTTSSTTTTTTTSTTTTTVQPSTTTTTSTTTQSDTEFLPNGCPKDFSVHFLLPHELDCSKFYYCNFGEKVERDCAPGTHFDPIEQVCNWPWAVNCTITTTTATTPTSTSQPTTNQSTTASTAQPTTTESISTQSTTSQLTTTQSTTTQSNTSTTDQPTTTESTTTQPTTSQPSTAQSTTTQSTTSTTAQPSTT
ncbi:unnamed protein product, partial [Leptidea sinapis]